MSDDKRSVFTDALETLGTVITENEKRDAIHLAVEPMIAGEYLAPGVDVGIGSDGKAHRKVKKHLGIVDPFLSDGVAEGSWFWLVIYPRQIKSLRHVWTHPDFTDTADTAPPTTSNKKTSEEWIRNFLGQRDTNVTYDQLMEEALSPSRYGGSNTLSFGNDIYGEIPDEFWTHVETVSGRTIPKESRATYFSCAC